MFYILFFHLSEETSFFFSFFLYFFQIFFLLASVSEFNCFLRSRCSMEMWCLDDIGRDSWDWVGPPAWERACFKCPEWGAEPRLYYCCCCLGHGLMTVYDHICFSFSLAFFPILSRALATNDLAWMSAVSRQSPPRTT